MIKSYTKIVFALVLAFLTACSESEMPYVERPANDLYMKGYDAILKGEYKEAAESFDEVERQHPYSEWATRGQLMAAYSNYLKAEYDKAIATLDVFIQLHPGYRHIDYAYYLRALCYYDRILAVSRDQKHTQEALKALSTVVKKFPTTKYGRDAQFKMDLVYDHLAGKEMSVGRYYMRRQFYLAAVNRFQAVIDAYPRTTHVPEALHRLVECYCSMGLKKEAQMTAAVLGHNFPGSEWYSDTYLVLKGEDLRPEWIRSDDGTWLGKFFK